MASSREFSPSATVATPKSAATKAWSPPTLSQDDNPFYVPPLAPISAEVEAWARALCIASDADPDPIIGFPPAPRWRSWAGYAEKSMRAAAALGYPPLRGPEGYCTEGTPDASQVPGMNKNKAPQ